MSSHTTLTTIDQEWTEFQKLIFRDMEISRVQREETRRAFYAGACVMLKMASLTGCDDISEEDGCKYLDELRQELVEFADDLTSRAQELN